MAIDSRYIYPVDDPLIPDSPADTPPLSDRDGGDLRSLCKYLRWVNNASGDLLAGLIATSCICGALQFRTHGWITGPAGSGKSYIMENIVARALDGIALHILGNSTEAGIRRHLSHDARPAIYDEAEGEGESGKKRRDMIIALMRASSTETKAKILLGSGGSRGESFPVRAQFILGSVGTALDRATDQTRCLLLTLASNTPLNATQRSDFESHFREIKDKIASLPEHLSARLIKRMTPMVHIVRANAEIFRRLIAAKFNSRIGDQIGTVLAGTYALENADKATELQAIEYIDNFPWSEYIAAQDPVSVDEGGLFNHLCAHLVRVETPTHGTVSNSVAELCTIVSSVPPNDPQEFDGLYPISRDMARRVLARIGILYAKSNTEEEDPQAPFMFWFANNHPEIKKIFTSSQFQQGYEPIIKRARGSLISPFSRSFAGVSARAIMVPMWRMVPPG